MPQISTAFVKMILANAPERSDRAELLALCGLTEAQLDDPNAQIAAPAYFQMLERIDEDSPQPPDFHVRTGEAMRGEHLGLVGLSFKVAPTLRDSFSRLGRYIQLITKLQTFDLVDEGEVCRFQANRPPALSQGAKLSYEASFGSLLSVAREAAGQDVAPVRVTYKHQAVGSREALRALFRCPVEFGAEHDAMIFAQATLDRSNLLADEGIWSFFASQLDDGLKALKQERSLSEDLSRWASNVFCDGQLTLAMAAHAMGVSDRTLQRRLADEGQTFNGVVDRARQDLAKHLLSNPRHTIADVAFMTGFAEQSAFNRAFKRWVGQTPRAFQMSAHAAG